VNKNNGGQIYIASLGLESHLLHTLESGHLTIAIEVARYDLYTSFCLNLPRLDFDGGSATVVLNACAVLIQLDERGYGRHVELFTTFRLWDLFIFTY